MRVPLGYKFILGFVAVVGVVALSPPLVQSLGYSPGVTHLLSTVVALTVGLILGWLFTRRFSGNIGVLTRSAEAISQGDLTRNISLPRTNMPDETHELAAAINLMVTSLRELVGHIRESSFKVAETSRDINGTAREVSCSTDEVARTMEQISRGAESQAAMVEQASGVIKDMAVSIELVASRARESSLSARETSQTAQRGVDLAKDSLSIINEFFVRMEELNSRFSQFHARLQRVNKVADFIGEISRQTNLLALNASIEAVRAGEYGKGFAVVADEVRKLADSSSKSVNEIMELVTLLREESQGVHENILESSRTIREGRKNIDATGAVFVNIFSTVVETERRTTSIAELSRMQLEGSARMVEAIDEIARVVDGNAAATEEVSAVAEEQSAAMQELARTIKELASLADELELVTNRFLVASEE